MPLKHRKRQDYYSTVWRKPKGGWTKQSHRIVVTRYRNDDKPDRSQRLLEF